MHRGPNVQLDEIIVFRQLTKKEVKQIADIFLRVRLAAACSRAALLH